MDSLPLAIALAPLGLYLLALGVLNLGRHPRVWNAAWDAALLAAALMGLAAVGPMNLLLPDDATVRFGIFVWPMLLMLYVLCVILYVMTARPRLIVANITAEQLRQLIEPLARRLDETAQVAGDAIYLPQLGLQFHLDATAGMRSVSLVAGGEHQSYSGWRRFGRELALELRKLEVSPNPRGFSLVAAGLALIVWPLAQLAQTPAHIALQQLKTILRL